MRGVFHTALAATPDRRRNKVIGRTSRNDVAPIAALCQRFAAFAVAKAHAYAHRLGVRMYRQHQAAQFFDFSAPQGARGLMPMILPRWRDFNGDTTLYSSLHGPRLDKYRRANAGAVEADQSIIIGMPSFSRPSSRGRPFSALYHRPRDARVAPFGICRCLK